MKLDVAGLGFTSYDRIGLVPHLPEPDGGMLLLDYASQGGGPVAQALVTLARLGASTGFVGRIGSDDTGLVMQRDLANEGVDLSRLQIEPGARSAECIILVEATSGKRSICAFPGDAGQVQLDADDLAFLCSGRFLHLDGHSPDAALDAARAAKAVGVRVCLDAGGPGPRVAELVAVTDILIAGERLARGLDPDGDDRNGAARLLEMGPSLVVVTRGERGSFTRTIETEFVTPAFSVNVVDTTGAGDVFHGAYLYGLLQNWPLETVANFAGATAALKCRRLGGRAGIPRLPEVLDFLGETGRDDEHVRTLAARQSCKT